MLPSEGPLPRVLQQVTIQIESNAQCKKNYGSYAPGEILDSMVCAGLPGRDSCQVNTKKTISFKQTKIILIFKFKKGRQWRTAHYARRPWRKMGTTRSCQLGNR